MKMSKCARILVVVGILVALAALLVLHGVSHFTAALTQHCDPQAKQCNETDHVYHLETGKCLRAGMAQINICGNNMVISPLPDCPIQGECECDYENNERHLVYDNETDQCYPIYSKGPCDEGYVVSISSTLQALECSPDICVEEKLKVSATQRDSIVPYENKCYSLNITLNEPGCKGQLRFWTNQVYPSCSPPATYQTGSLSAPLRLRCEPASVKIFKGYCHPKLGTLKFLSAAKKNAVK